MAATDPCELPADRRRGSTFGWSLGVVLRRWHEYVEEMLNDLPHGSRGYHILSVVVHEDVPTQGALATRLGIDRSVLTYVIDDLENAGLIERKLDPQDRRARRIVATDRGRAALTEAERRVTHAEDHVLGGLPEDQRDTFRDFAARAAEAIHAAAPATDPCVAVRSVLPPAEQPAG
ncbi:MarR family winged helix-turn-helix transcriptional regulator [Micromonospora sp. WMMD967]|uniref:MarR family winged helix-turn-helix transcriptional regulator n=1 Tax=Micromonospora sp. WMMD967 TaxID=3016101 RepID=UPI002417834C|nr:MarR family winged helix-turn-helix transcriptional regulator [Micromonospora sp. WMMD967]MDG4840025.1 MarR family winged helix-turn-helix transcriptional regulator [Micromonospora sp. WMMD967]